MSRMPFLSSAFGIGSMPHSGMPGPPCGPALRSTRTWSRVMSRFSSSIAAFSSGIAVEDHGRTLMDMEFRIAGGRLDDGARGREIALQHRQRAFVIDGIVERPDHVVVVDFGAREPLAERPAGDGDAVAVQPVAEPFHQRPQAAGIEEVLHQVGLAASGGCWRSPASCGSSHRDRRASDRCRPGAPWRSGGSTALVEQPVAMATVTAFSTDFSRDDLVGGQVLPDHARRCGGRRRSSCGCDWRRRRGSSWRRAGTVPCASAIAVMVLAVPMVMQWP